VKCRARRPDRVAEDDDTGHLRVRERSEVLRHSPHPADPTGAPPVAAACFLLGARTTCRPARLVASAMIRVCSGQWCRSPAAGRDLQGLHRRGFPDPHPARTAQIAMLLSHVIRFHDCPHCSHRRG
jgi:hypothetical protein